MVDLVTGLKGVRKERLEARQASILSTQKELLGRMERILRGLLLKASPELTEPEKKWFDELNRMKSEVLGSGKWDERSLVKRTRLMEVEFERILPLLEQVRERERHAKIKNEKVNESLGFNQAFELGKRSEEQ